MRNRVILKKIIGLVFIGFGLSILFASILVNIRQQVSQKQLIEQFNEMVQKTASSETEEEYSTLNPADEGELIYNLRIPSIDSENPVCEGTSREVLRDSLGHQAGTAYVGENGNCVIAGHRNYTFGKFFNRLDEVRVGDIIYVDTKNDTREYKVKEIKVVEPTDTSVLDDTENEQLTLYTCTPIYVATHRLVIISEPL
jgi:sortase A